MKNEAYRQSNLLCQHLMSDCEDGDVSDWIVETWLEQGEEFADRLEARYKVWKHNNNRQITVAEMQALEDNLERDVAKAKEAEDYNNRVN